MPTTQTEPCPFPQTDLDNMFAKEKYHIDNILNACQTSAR